MAGRIMSMKNSSDPIGNRTRDVLACSASTHCATACPTIIIIIIIIMDISCHRPFLPGTSLEPTVIPTAQASSFTLQYFPYYV